MAAIDQFIDQAKQNAAALGLKGTELEDYLKARGIQYDANEEDYRGRADAAYGDLAQTPGYTDQETGAILGDPNAAFKYYDPTQLSNDVNNSEGLINATSGNYGTGLRQAADRTAGNLGSKADAVGGGITGAGSRYGSGIRGAASTLGTGITNAAAQAKGELADPANQQEQQLGDVYGYLKGEGDDAVGDYGSDLTAATDPGKLGLSQDFAADYGLTDQEAQNFRDVAAQTTAGQYRKMNDEAQMRAAAAGNTSPAALAAIKERLGVAGAAEAGDAATRAEMAANAEKANRAKTLEGMRLGTEQDIASRLTSNAGNLYGARSGQATNLAGLEQSGINSVAGNRQAAIQHAADLGYDAASASGKALMDAESQAGNADIDTQKAAGNLQYDAAQRAADADYKAADQGGQAATDAAKYNTANRINVDSANQATGQGLATSADTASSNRNTGVANQRITGQGNVRNYYTGQQAAAQQGSQNAAGTAVNAYGTQAAAQNTATGQGIQAATQKDNKPGLFDKVLGAAGGILSGVAGVKKAFADGGTVTQPTEAVVGEAGPEKIVKVNPWKQAAKTAGRYRHSGPDAIERFTKTPININNIAATARDINGSLEGASIPVSGMYSPERKAMDISINSDDAGYDDLMQAITHEATHAALDGHTPKQVTPPAFDSLKNFIVSPLDWADDPESVVKKKFLQSSFAGDATQEIPAQMVAYKEKDLGVSPGTRSQYLSGLEAALDPNRRGVIQRLSSTNDARKHADGTIATGPEVADVGEAGPEKVIKTRYGGRGMQQQQRGGYGGGRPQKPMQRSRYGSMSMRGDGSSVPGNEPGGANGMYGQYGQMPSQQPTQAFDQSVQSRRDQGQQQGWGAPMQNGGDYAPPPKQSPYRTVSGMGQMMNQSQQPPVQQPPDTGYENMPSMIGGRGASFQTPTPQVQASTQQPPAVQQQPVQSVSAQPKPQGYASPFGNMNFGTPQMADGGMAHRTMQATVGENGPEKVFQPSRYRSMSNEPDEHLITKPTRVLLEEGDAVVPLDGHASSKITPGMVEPRRYRMTGPSSLHNPMRPMPPAIHDRQMNNHPAARR